MRKVFQGLVGSTVLNQFSQLEMSKFIIRMLLQIRDQFLTLCFLGILSHLLHSGRLAGMGIARFTLKHKVEEQRQAAPHQNQGTT